jgi:hypothetical protein
MGEVREIVADQGSGSISLMSASVYLVARADKVAQSGMIMSLIKLVL